ncbi:RNA binding protein-like protein 2 [Sarcoptes scabiei]|uniref:RNA binding protein-like protein 2 n=1 Tax=Sarcoptes scabiei TaxID=52283 RepID=A0A131ZVP2_SARSC|nr:RNA binding protein-like protein 2 [Sarcoptes scabiei]
MNSQSTSFDVVDYENVRLPNVSQSFDEHSSEKFLNQLIRFDFVADINQIDPNWLKDAQLLKKFRTVENLINIHYNEKKHSLVCLGFIWDQTDFARKKFMQQCKLLTEWHFKAVKETSHMTKHLLMPKDSISDDIPTLCLTVEKNLIGLAIGKHGSNIQKARQVEGIKSIELHDLSNTFIIKGSTLDSCNIAASLLHFKAETLEITGQKDFFNNKNLISELVVKSGLFECQVFDPRMLAQSATHHQRSMQTGHDFNHGACNNLDAHTFEIRLIGTIKAIDDFKIMLNFQLGEYASIKELKDKYNLNQNSQENGFRNSLRRRHGKKFSDIVKT